MTAFREARAVAKKNLIAEAMRRPDNLTRKAKAKGMSVGKFVAQTHGKKAGKAAARIVRLRRKK